MNLNKKYTDTDGNECNILQLVKREPEWAANTIQGYEHRLAKIEDFLKKKIQEYELKNDPWDAVECQYGFMANALKEVLKEMEPAKNKKRVLEDLHVEGVSFVSAPRCEKCGMRMKPCSHREWTCKNKECHAAGLPIHTGVYPMFRIGGDQ